MRLKNILRGIPLVLLSAVCVRAEWGVNLTANHWQMDGDDLIKEMDDSRNNGILVSGTVEMEKLAGEAELFYEQPFQEYLSWGVSVGGSMHPSAKLDEDFGAGTTLKMENSALSFPVSIYFRKQSRPSFSWVGGGGVELLKAKTEYNLEVPGGFLKGDFEDDKIVPFVRVGGNFHITPSFSLGLSVKWLFSGELEEFKGNPTSSVALPSGEYRLIMVNDPPAGEFVAMTNGPVPAGARPYRVDFSGPRIGLALRLAFGGGEGYEEEGSSFESDDSFF